MWRFACAAVLWCLLWPPPLPRAAEAAPDRAGIARTAYADPPQTEPRVAPPATPETVKTTVYTLATALTTVAGSSVWILNAQIEEVVAGRAFILKSFDEDRFHPQTNDSRALVVTSSPVSDIDRGAALEVIGKVFTVAGARAQPAWPETLTETDVKPYRDWPIVIAAEVRTPAGIVLCPYGLEAGDACERSGRVTPSQSPSACGVRRAGGSCGLILAGS